MAVKSKYSRLFAVVILAFMANLSVADNTNYQRKFLAGGISIEVPSHWFLHSDVERKNFSAAAEGALQKSGIVDSATENKSRLLAASALPEPSGAKIRMNVIRPATFSGADLRAMTAKDINDIKTRISLDLKKSMQAIGAELLSVETPRIVSIRSQTAILFEYRRSDLRAPSPWTVRLYRIPVRDMQIELTMSFRESDRIIYEPIIEYAKRSLMF